MPSLKEIAAQRERAVLRAFRQTIQSVKDQATIAEIVRLLETGNVDGVVRLLDLSETRFEPLYESIRQSYREGGLTGADQIGRIPTPDGTLVARFNVRSPAAEAWLSSMSSRLIVEISEQQRGIVRDVLTQSLSQGRNPRSAALDLVGRVDQRTRRRVGGFIGLTDQQATWALSARERLQNLDPEYLNMALRDKRFDGAFKRAIEDGKPLTQGQVDNAVSRYQSRAERYRGETIARTESINSLRAGQHEAIDQAVEIGEVETQDIEREWSATLGPRTRDQHVSMDGQKVGQGEPFVAPDGSRLLYPGDNSLGATAANTINCRCSVITRINFGKQAKRIEGFD